MLCPPEFRVSAISNFGFLLTMLVAIPNLLTPQQVAYARQKLDAAVNWIDGAATAGVLAKQVKRNRQIDQSHHVGQEIGQMILKALASNGTFMSAAQPVKVLPPKFNRYEGGEHYGAHIDNAIMDIPASGGGAPARGPLDDCVLL
jgi:PKHD-type hydroxylase